MSVPLEYDFAQVKLGDGASPEVFTVICDLTQVNVNEGAETSTRYRRDCATPGTPATRKSRVIGTFWGITGTGLINATQNDDLRAVLGIGKNYQVDVYEDDGTAAGNLLGTYSGEAIMTARDIAINREGDSSQSITLEGQNALTFTPSGDGS